jgi:DNA-binding SARP family transcriptional activator
MIGTEAPTTVGEPARHAVGWAELGGVEVDERLVDVRFWLLGDLEVLVAGRPVALSAGRLRTVLAVLLLRANRVVSVDELADRVWGTVLPENVRGTLQTYVMRLRKAFARATGGAVLVHTRGGGYLIEVPPDGLDLMLFDELCRRADEAAAAGDVDTEQRHLREALALWRGPALAGVNSERLFLNEASVLEEKRVQVAERLCSLLVHAGRHVEAVAPLRALTAEQPLRERAWYLLVLALYRSRRQAEALQAFATVRRLLADDLGLTPGEDLRQLHHAVLNQQVDELDREVALAPSVRRWTVQRQLPPDVAGFVGRRSLMARVAAALHRSDAGVPVVGVQGPAGIGKTTLAVHIAHRIAERFPDGQWYVPLSSADGPRPQNTVLADLLTASGISEDHIPESVEARSALLRARTAGRRVLMVLDDAADVAQVNALVPGASGCAVIVCSRSPLSGLTARYGTAGVRVPPLDLGDSIDLLAHLIGRRRLDAEPAAASTLVRLCGRQPLALRTAGAELAENPQLPLTTYVDDLLSAKHTSTTVTPLGIHKQQESDHSFALRASA